MRRLLNHSARLPALLLSAEYHFPRPLDYKALLQLQRCASALQHDEAGECSYITFSEGDAVVVLPADLLLSVEILYGGSSWAWCGPPVKLIEQLDGEPVSARVWDERPAFINCLNRLNDERPEAADWYEIRMRVFVTRGLRTMKVFESNVEGGDGDTWSCTGLECVGEVQTSVDAGVQDDDDDDDEANAIMVMGELSDDGEVDLDFYKLEDDELEALNAEAVRQMLSSSLRMIDSMAD